MLPLPFRLRRGRRTDFVAVMELLAQGGSPVPPADRSTLRRFRRLTADLGTDLYVAVQRERVVGAVHVTYARQLATGARARLELLVVAPDARRQRIGSALVVLAVRRAQRRGCTELLYTHAAPDGAAGAFLARTGWTQAGEMFSMRLPSAAG